MVFRVESERDRRAADGAERAASDGWAGDAALEIVVKGVERGYFLEFLRSHESTVFDLSEARPGRLVFSMDMNQSISSEESG